MGEVKRARGAGHAKLLLFGEHAAVYGHPAVGLSLRRTTRAEIALDGSGAWRLSSTEAHESAGLRDLLGRLEELLPALHPGGSVRIDSDIPPGLGFGSSAALCAALASAFAAVFPVEQGGRSVWELAHEAERLFHGTPSGIDTGLALLDGLVLFHPEPPGLPRARRLPGLELELVVGAVPRRAESAALIRGLRERMQAGDGRTATALAELGALALQAAALLEQDIDPRRRVGELGRLAGLAQAGLAGLGLSTPELEDMLACGRAAGALGGKLSGAGGGGAFFLLFPERAAAVAAADGLQALARRRGLPTTGTIEALSYRGGEHGQGEG